MKRRINLAGKTYEYDLEYKNVKNINLRIKSDCTIHVSASRYVSIKEIESFMASRAAFIIKAVEKFESSPTACLAQYFDEKQIKPVINEICKKVYPCFESRGVKYPVIKFRKMVSRWGSCNYVSGIVTFNTSLMYAPYECIEYVVLHEFCHFLQPDHSRLFYAELEKLCPQHKKLRQILRQIPIRNIK